MNKTVGPNFGDKNRSSLAIKLNLRLAGRLASGFLSLNILLLIIGLSVVMGKAEQKAQDIIVAISQDPENPAALDPVDRNFQVLVTGESPKGLTLPALIRKYLPEHLQEVKRSITLPGGGKDRGLGERIGSATYNLAFPVKGKSFKIVYSLGTDLRLLFYLAVILVFFELLVLIKNMIKGTRSIKKVLKPLSEIAEEARRLNEELYYQGNTAGYDRIKDLTGVISDIDASRLDRRLEVDGSENELKDLALAINGMLNRISAAYQSQLRFVSDASHELRTPISVIQGYANLLDRWGKKDETTLQESIEAIKGETEGMKDLVEQLLFLARGDNDTLQLHRENFDCCDLIEETVAEAEMIEFHHNFEMDLDRPAYISADKQLFKQVVRILVDNSIKYSPGDTRIIIRVRAGEDPVRISIQDEGIGIASEDLPNIFDRFYRSDESRARRTGGSGLGLSIARWIVERHGGYLEIMSRLGIGTRITLVFPVAPPPVPSAVDQKQDLGNGEKNN